MSFLIKISHKSIVLPILGFLLMSSSTLESPSREYQIKAVFLFNFIQFVEWPGTYSKPNDPFIIGIVGKDPFGSYLDQIVAGEKINNKPIIVQRYPTINELQKCHLLYINLSETKEREETVSRLQGKHTLTVCDATNFMQQGGMVRFFAANNKIQFQINPEAVKDAELIISSKLLRLAVIFNSNKK